MLLAAAIPARDGEHVVEGGCGAGAGLLCLAARLPGIAGTGLERDAALVGIARENASENGWAARLSFLAAEIGAPPSACTSLLPSGLPSRWDHAFANPPYHTAPGTPSPLAAREGAKRAGADTFGLWAAALASGLRHRGTLTMIAPAAVLPGLLEAASAAGCGSASILPLWPRAGRPAKLVIVQSRKGGRAPPRLLPGLTLHGADAGFTAEAEAILRGGGSLAL